MGENEQSVREGTQEPEKGKAELVMEGMPVPSVGRIVHFYTRDSSKQFNGQGEGPYPAVVTQVFGGEPLMANLKVLPGFGDPYDAGSVPYKVYAHGYVYWWEWPPHL